MSVKAFGSGVKQGMHGFARAVSALTNTGLLIVVYFIAVGITSLIAKVSGKRFLARTRKQSYWRELNLKKQPQEYYRQF